jgi:O-antigen ligase
MIVSSLLLVIGLLFWKQKEFQSIRRNFPRIFVALIIASIGLATWVAITKFQTIQIHFDPSDPYLRPFSIRLAIWQNALSEILADPWLGYGTGDSLGAMLSAYESSHFAIGTQNGFNAHNQFFELWLQIGILGPVLFLLMLVHGFILAWKANGWIRCSALIVFFMLSLSESTLMTFRGVCFLCFILFITFDPENNEGITGP